jgi:leader peptidase (prepilin peptidase)/N-methyltransferase
LLEHSSLSNIPTWLISIGGAFAGAIIGGGLLWLLGYTWKRMRGVEALGLGDVKMMSMIGAYLGIAKTFLVLTSSILLMIPIAGVVMLMLIRRKRDDIQYLLPSGFIWGIPAIAVTLFGDRILELLSWQ